MARQRKGALSIRRTHEQCPDRQGTGQGVVSLARFYQKVSTASAPNVKLSFVPLVKAAGFWLNGLFEVKA
jgi:hypothetical protein